MHTCYFLLLLLITAFGARSQSVVNKSFHDYNDVCRGLTCIKGKYYISSNTFTAGFWDNCILNSLNADGTVRFRTEVNKHEYTEITAMTESHDRKLVLIGFARGCDYIDDSQSTFIMKINEQGEVLFDNTFSSVQRMTGLCDIMKDIVPYNDGTYYAVGDSLLFHFDTNGATINHRRIPVMGVREIDLMENGDLMLSFGGSNGAGQVAVIDTAVTLLSEHTLDAPSKKLIIGKPGVYYTLGDKINKFDAGFTLLASSSGAQLNSEIINDFTLANDTIYACGINWMDSSSFMLAFDTSLTLISRTVNTTKGVVPVSMCVGDKVAMVSNCKGHPLQSSFFSFTSFPKTHNYDYQSDIGITKISCDSSWVQVNYSSTQNMYYASGLHYIMTLFVKNYSTDTIHSFNVNHFTGQTVCGRKFFTLPVSGISLAPNDSIAVTTPWIDVYNIGTPLGPELPAYFLQNDLCFNTSIPNHGNDKMIDNDMYCKSMSINIVGVSEMEKKEFSIFPNPCSGHLHIESAQSITGLEIIDLSGRKMKVIDAENGLSEEIDLSSLNDGIYQVRIYTGNDSGVQKLVIQK